MSDINLTNLTKSILNDIYAEYLERIKNGMSSQEARIFVYRVTEKCKPLNTIPKDDVDETLKELKNLGFVEAHNILGDFKITPNAISYMENHFTNGIKQVIDTVAKFIP